MCSQFSSSRPIGFETCTQACQWKTDQITDFTGQQAVDKAKFFMSAPVSVSAL